MIVMELFDFQTVQRLNPQNRRVQEGNNKAQQLKKEATRIDYYKILGIEKTATPDQISAQYKKAVKTWHTNRVSNPMKKKEAESKMKMISIAYEIIHDRHKKQL
jgi:preprotein translocase subunit Sec63